MEDDTAPKLKLTRLDSSDEGIAKPVPYDRTVYVQQGQQSRAARSSKRPTAKYVVWFDPETGKKHETGGNLKGCPIKPNVSADAVKSQINNDSLSSSKSFVKSSSNDIKSSSTELLSKSNNDVIVPCNLISEEGNSLKTSTVEKNIELRPDNNNEEKSSGNSNNNNRDSPVKEDLPSQNLTSEDTSSQDKPSQDKISQDIPSEDTLPFVKPHKKFKTSPSVGDMNTDFVVSKKFKAACPSKPSQLDLVRAAAKVRA